MDESGSVVMHEVVSQCICMPQKQIRAAQIAAMTIAENCACRMICSCN